MPEIPDRDRPEGFRPSVPHSKEKKPPTMSNTLPNYCSHTETEIFGFAGEFQFLSNFYEAPATYKGITFQNTEAAFQAQKCYFENEKKSFAYLTAGKAKREGRKVDLIPNWEETKDNIMKEILLDKFSQNTDLKEKLLATGEKKLTEANHWNDRYWGTDTKGIGKNQLGKALMEVRAMLATPPTEK